jgi:hypothetical protein
MENKMITVAERMGWTSANRIICRFLSPAKKLELQAVKKRFNLEFIPAASLPLLIFTQKGIKLRTNVSTI